MACVQLSAQNAATVAAAAAAAADGRPPPPRTPTISAGPGLLDLLLKCASHPSIHICAIAIDVLAKLVATTESGFLAPQLLPVLQRRAITPHHFITTTMTVNTNEVIANDSGDAMDETSSNNSSTSNNSNNNNVIAGSNNESMTTRTMEAEVQIPCIVAADICGVSFQEFENFRNTVLKDALLECWRSNPEHYMASCTTAIEEFCNDDNNHNNTNAGESESGGSSPASPQVSFHLEAALFCIGAVADDALMSTSSNCSSTSSPPLAAGRGAVSNRNNNDNNNIESDTAAGGGGGPSSFQHSSYLERCTAAIATKPTSLTSNPLTLAQACKFLQKVRVCFPCFGIVSFSFLYLHSLSHGCLFVCLFFSHFVLLSPSSSPSPSVNFFSTLSMTNGTAVIR